MRTPFTLVLLLMLCLTASTASAGPARRLQDLRVDAGTVITAVMIDGAPVVGGFVRSSSNELVLNVGGVERVIPAAQIATLSIRGDSLVNGALIGVAVVVVAALASPYRDEGPTCGNSCLGHPVIGFTVGLGAAASVGAFIDWRHRGETVIYRTP